MQNPQEELPTIVPHLLATESPDIQRETVMKYFTEDASFSHPFCRVQSAPQSRDDILSIYQFYRFLSPKIEVDILNVVFDPERNTLFLDVSQLFHLWFLPVKPVPTNLKVYLKLVKKNKLYYISSQEDFYHPDELCKLLFPPIAPLVNYSLAIGRRATILGTSVVQSFGYWRPSDTRKENDERKDDPDDKKQPQDPENTKEGEGGEWHEVRRAKKNRSRKKDRHHQDSASKTGEKNSRFGEADSQNGASSS